MIAFGSNLHRMKKQSFTGVRICLGLQPKQKEITSSQLYSSEFCNIFQNSFYKNHLRETAPHTLLSESSGGGFKIC